MQMVRFQVSVKELNWLRSLLADGSALRKLEELRRFRYESGFFFFLEQKEAEVAQLVNEPVGSVRSTYSLFDFLTKQKGQLQLITEVKKS